MKLVPPTGCGGLFIFLGKRAGLAGRVFWAF